MYDFDDVNPKKNENEEQECIESSAEEEKSKPFENEESIEMKAKVISAEEAENQKAETLNKQAEQAETQEEIKEEIPRPSVREYHYEEKVKKTPKKKKGWAKFIAGCLIVSIAGGGSIGAGYGAVQHYFQKESGVQTTNVTDTEKISFLTDGLSTVDIVKKVKPSVVSVSTTVTGTAKYFGKYAVPYESEGAGSGVIFYSDDSKVAIATNNHVIEGASSIFVTFEGNISVSAKAIGTKSESDLAVLSVSWDDLKVAGITSVATATFGDSDALEVGEYVIAIGNAMGMGLSATDGIISMKEQTINVDGNALKVLQTSAAINSGNSGGALVNGKGEVIGINTAKYNSSMAEGMGYAIPSNYIKPIVEELLESGTQPKPYIGITGTSITEENASLYKLPVGALIMEVTENGPAANAGLQVGDVITQYDGKTVMDMDTLVELVNGTEIGKTVDVHAVRDGQKSIDLKIKIGDKNA